jgi:cyclopropane fatty-acyl-phospholipid synthase-like methyltransferase
VHSAEIYAAIKAFTGHAAVGADFGCGCGDYVLAMFNRSREDRRDLGSVVLLDQSAGMLGNAKDRLQDLLPVRTHLANLVQDQLPVTPGSLDWAISTQSSHHWGIRNIPAVFEKIRATLKDGAPFVFVFSTPFQIQHGQWELGIHGFSGESVPVEKDPGVLYSIKFPPQEWVTGNLRAAGFSLQEAQIIRDPYTPAEEHERLEHIFDPDFQAGGSFFQYARQLGLSDAYLARAREMIDSGEMRKHFEQSEKIRRTIGVATAVVAIAS